MADGQDGILVHAWRLRVDRLRGQAKRLGIVKNHRRLLDASNCGIEDRQARTERVDRGAVL